MKIGKSLQNLESDAWCEKLEFAVASIDRVQLSADDHDSQLARRVIKSAYLQAATLRDNGGVVVEIYGNLENPDCFVCGAGVLEHGAYLLFCSDECKDVALAVRYARKKIDEEIPWTFDLLVGFGQKIFPWSSSGSTYDSRRRNLSEDIRSKVFERDERQCVLCGEPATQIDHIAGSSSDPSNLRAVCAACNRKHMLENLVPITNEAKRKALKDRVIQLSRFIGTTIPSSPSFDHTNWSDKWRSYSKMRRASLPVPEDLRW